MNFLDEESEKFSLSTAHFRIKAGSAATNFPRDNARTRVHTVPKFGYSEIFPATVFSCHRRSVFIRHTLRKFHVVSSSAIYVRDATDMHYRQIMRPRSHAFPLLPEKYTIWETRGPAPVRGFMKMPKYLSRYVRCFVSDPFFPRADTRIHAHTRENVRNCRAKRPAAIPEVFARNIARGSYIRRFRLRNETFRTPLGSYEQV